MANGFGLFMGGMMIAGGVLFVQHMGDVIVSYVPWRGQHKTLSGWIKEGTGLSG